MYPAFALVIFLGGALVAGCGTASSRASDTGAPLAGLSAAQSGGRAAGPDAGRGEGATSIMTSTSLIGRWLYSGNVPARIKLAVSFHADKTLNFAAQVSPATNPPGAVDPKGCITTHIVNGTYSTSVAAGGNTLMWAFTDATVNQIAGCQAESMNSPGDPIGADKVASLISQGILPPYILSYTLTPTALVIVSTTASGVGGGAGTTFVKAP